MALFERALRILFPRWSADREATRRAADLVRGYDGAGLPRRAKAWRRSSGSANAELRSALKPLREHARELVRNNPFAARIVDVWAAHLVGTGIEARSNTKVASIDGKVDGLFAEWAEVADHSGQHDLWGLQTLAVRAMVESGDALIRRIVDRNAPVLPLRLQVLEGDHLDTTKDGPLKGGGRIVMGVEFDKRGRRVFYHLFGTHPGEALYGYELKSERVPAEDVIHLSRITRPGQVRGVPWLAPVIASLMDIGEYWEASLLRAKVEACFSAFVTRPEGQAASPLTGAMEQADDGDLLEELEAGSITYLEAGEKVEFASPTATDAQGEFVRAHLMSAAVGGGITYDQISGDLKGANYSSLRAGKIEFRRQVEQQQYQTVIPQMCRPIGAWFSTAAILAGKLRPRVAGYPMKWVAPSHEAIDPLKDMQADVLAVQSGAMSPQTFTARWGYDFRDVIREWGEAIALMDGANVKLSIDARGSSKAAPAAADDADEKDSDNAENEDAA